MVIENFLYRIEGFVPPSRGETRMGMYGFGVKLDLDFAKQAFQNELSDKFYEVIKSRGERIVRSVFPRDKYIHEPYLFAGNENGIPSILNGNRTFLANSFIVPGNACSLNLDRDETSRLTEKNPYPNYVEYSPHNVDSIDQSYALLSLFMTWFDAVDATLSYKENKE